MEALEGEEV